MNLRHAPRERLIRRQQQTINGAYPPINHDDCRRSRYPLKRSKCLA